MCSIWRLGHLFQVILELEENNATHMYALPCVGRVVVKYPFSGMATTGIPLKHPMMVTHFSMHVFADQSAYIRAAGSSFARNPTNFGFSWSFESPSCTSANNPLQIVPAKKTLHVAGTVVEAAFEVIVRGIRRIRCIRREVMRGS